ncbi:hypothetical protein ACPOL_5149 [Acidisarcina polymorpha]|uniref:Uncharacterized protein n=1 Tax=Acidisarcina polymorpha TaxID=2211140 RepID=A0A2Z5G5A0_9BACT|nr:hypothetical protein [Acidisarcina polymorpha]AXC14403.1 hypothetical protein ACPOL_5149 [Acidisarcina polymorpha]
MMLPIRTLEIAAWGLDDYEFRPHALSRRKNREARRLVAERPPFESLDPVCVDETIAFREAFDRHISRRDLQTEMLGLDWSLGIVDLRRLLAFQRRLSFNPKLSPVTVPRQSDWPGLMDIAFASRDPVSCEVVRDAARNTVIFRSTNPNLHVRATDDPGAPISVDSGSPFFEVASYRNRWFLRDGYHRAYALLRAGVFRLPAVIVKASNLGELGAIKPWFFTESVLLGEQPPFVTDFLNGSLTIEYDRPPIVKTLRVTIEESIATVQPTQLSGVQP